MNCPHCKTENPTILPFNRVVDGGLAYAQTCPVCGHILKMRPHQPDDPPIEPPNLSSREVARLRFLRWRMENGALDPSDTPPHAA